MLSKLTEKYTELSQQSYNSYPQAALTKQHVINTTLLGFALLALTGIISGVFFNINPGLAALATSASSIALVGVWLFVAFGRNAQKYGKALFIAFSLLEGVILGSLITAIAGVEFEDTSGVAIIGQAIIATTAIFLACLIAYRTGAIRITQGSKLQAFLHVAVMGAVFISIANLGLTLFTGSNALWGEGILPIVFAVVALILGAMLLIDDFGQIDYAVEAGADEDFKWMLALALLSTIVWIFVEMLRLLYSLAANRN